LTEDWEQSVGADLVPFLAPAGLFHGAQRPVEMSALPAGAEVALSDSIGRLRREDLLIVPAVAWPCGRWRRRLYSPLCVVAAGERGAGLWVEALPVPDVRVALPFGGIGLIERQAEGIRRRMIVAGREGAMSVRYEASGDVPADALMRRMRRRVAGPPGPVPAGYAGGRGTAGGRVTGGRLTAGGRFALRLRDGRDLWFPMLGTDDRVVSVGGRFRLSRGVSLLAVTSRELIIVRSVRAPGRPWRRVMDALYIPRQAIERASLRSGTLELRTAGVDVRVRLRSRRIAATASVWLSQLLNDHAGAV
jgi:hypothetical protein